MDWLTRKLNELDKKQSEFFFFNRRITLGHILGITVAIVWGLILLIGLIYFIPALFGLTEFP